LGTPHFDAELDELGQLAQTAGMTPVARITCKRRAPDAALFVGSGKADEIKMMAAAHGAQEVLFDQSLSPAQQRNLERHLELPVNDRTLLILEIFAQPRRQVAGGACPFAVPQHAPGAPLVAPGASNRWRRCAWRPGRKAN
jgi:GTP-binding protein HflX